MGKSVKKQEEVETEMVETETVETGTELVESTETLPSNYASIEALAALEDEDDGEDYGGIDRITLEQNGDDEGTVKGEFFCKATCESLSGFPAVLLRKSKSRVMWPEEYNADNKMLCASDDGITPITDHDDFKPKAKTCKACAYGSWKRTKKNGKTINTPPACGEIADMILLNMDTFMPVVYSVKSTALGATNQGLLKILRKRKKALTIQRKRAGLPPALWSAFAFEIGSELKKSPKGSAYIPTYSNIVELDDAQKDAMASAVESVQDIDIHYRGGQEDDYSGSGSDGTRSEDEGAFDEIPADDSDGEDVGF